MPTTITGTSGIDKVQPNSIDQEDLKWVPPFTKEYVSAEQVITAAGLLTLPHLLGVRPKLVTAELVCKTSEAGYSIGAVISIPTYQFASDAAPDFGFNTRLDDASNIIIRFGSGGRFFSGNATTGAAVTLTSANWRLIVRARA